MTNQKETRKAYYEKHKEELKAKQNAYYQEHKEEIKAKARAKRAAEKEEGIERTRKKYVYEKPLNEKQIAKRFLKPLKDKFKGFKFGIDGSVLLIEVKLPFRCVKIEYGVKHCDEEELAKLQKELRNRVRKLLKHNHIVIVDCQYAQLFISKNEDVDAVCEETRNFVKEKLAIYGQYYKNNKKCNKDFE